MRIIFIGSVNFSAHMLQKLLSLKANVVGVCTRALPKEEKSDRCDLSAIADKHTIPSLVTEDINAPATYAWIKRHKPDIIFCFGWSALIKKELLLLPPMGIVGFHPTKLPHNRGRHPLIWTLVLGLKESAATFFFMREGADDGEILSQKSFTISYEDDARTLYAKVIATASQQLETFLPQLQKREYPSQPQDHTKANIWRKRSYKDGIIDFKMNSRTIYNLVRALTRPYPGAVLRYKEQDITVWRIKELQLDMPNIEPGKVLQSSADSIVVKSADGAVAILEHTFESLPKEGEYL